MLMTMHVQLKTRISGCMYYLLQESPKRAGLKLHSCTMISKIRPPCHPTRFSKFPHVRPAAGEGDCAPPRGFTMQVLICDEHEVWRESDDDGAFCIRRGMVGVREGGVVIGWDVTRLPPKVAHWAGQRPLTSQPRRFAMCFF